MIGRFRRRATAEEQRFDGYLAAVIAGQSPVHAPVEYGDELIMAQELSRQMAPLSELPTTTETRLKQKVADGVAVQERRSFWRRSFAARPLRTAATAALVLALAVGALTPLGGHARAAASHVWDELVDPGAGTEQLESFEINEDGSVTITHQDGTVTTVPAPGDDATRWVGSSDDPEGSDGSVMETIDGQGAAAGAVPAPSDGAGSASDGAGSASDGAGSASGGTGSAPSGGTGAVPAPGDEDEDGS